MDLAPSTIPFPDIKRIFFRESVKATTHSTSETDEKLYVDIPSKCQFISSAIDNGSGYISLHLPSLDIRYPVRIERGASCSRVHIASPRMTTLAAHRLLKALSDLRLTSRYTKNLPSTEEQRRRLVDPPVLHLRFPAEAVASSTPGHTHLYIRREMPHKQYGVLIKALVEARIVEERFYRIFEHDNLTLLLKPGYTTEMLAQRATP